MQTIHRSVTPSSGAPACSSKVPLLPQPRKRHRHALPAARLQAHSSSSMPAGAGAGEPVIDVTTNSRPPLPELDESLDPEVRAALQKVAAAVQAAETTIEHIEELPSARLPTAWDRLAAALRPVIQAAAVAAACTAIHSCGLAVRVLGSLAAGAALALAGWRRSSLSASGAAAACIVGWGTLGASFTAGVTLLAFFFASSAITRLGDEEKAVDEEHKKGGQRDWKQVLCNAAVPMGLALAAAVRGGGGSAALAPCADTLLTALAGGFMGYYACCCGDTWSSELGQLSPEEPRLITTLRPVRKGTNGGVTLLGLAASLAGGLFVGLVFYACAAWGPGAAAVGPPAQLWRLVPLGLGAGLLGSLIDSVLGATIQFSGYNRVTGKITGRPGADVSPISGLAVLDNNMVNMVSATLTAGLTATACLALFC